jgi:acyl-coenzyme A thioesterase PaaI-like protein
MAADLDALIALMPLAGHLGLVLDEADASRVIIRLDWAPHLYTTAGILHGGARSASLVNNSFRQP